MIYWHDMELKTDYLFTLSYTYIFYKIWHTGPFKVDLWNHKNDADMNVLFSPSLQLQQYEPEEKTAE